MLQPNPGAGTRYMARLASRIQILPGHLLEGPLQRMRRMAGRPGAVVGLDLDVKTGMLALRRAVEDANGQHLVRAVLPDAAPAILRNLEHVEAAGRLLDVRLHPGCGEHIAPWMSVGCT